MVQPAPVYIVDPKAYASHPNKWAHKELMAQRDVTAVVIKQLAQTQLDAAVRGRAAFSLFHIIDLSLHSSHPEHKLRKGIDRVVKDSKHYLSGSKKTAENVLKGIYLPIQHAILAQRDKMVKELSAAKKSGKKRRK